MFLDDLQTLPIISNLVERPSFDEVEKAVLSLKGNKAVGHDDLFMHDEVIIYNGEVIMYCGCVLDRRLHNFILDCWSAKFLPTKWKNAKIILVHKQNGDRTVCGMSLLSWSGKLQAKINVTRLQEHAAYLVLLESQCGFRRWLSTIDVIFVARQL